VNPILAAIAQHAAGTPDACALGDGVRTLSYREVGAAVNDACAALGGESAAPVALALDNGPTWAIADLALLTARRPCVPLPPFFSAAQQAHALRDAGAAVLLTDRAEPWEALLHANDIAFTREPDLDIAGCKLARLTLDLPRADLPPGTIKITYTSGTTGEPKGVCLGEAAIADVARSLVQVARFTANDRHLALLPLSTLLENIAGLYAPLSAGARALLPALRDVGLAAGAGIDMGRAAQSLVEHRATTAITVPELLAGLCLALERGAARPQTMRFLAVGGARVSAELIWRAARAGLPVYQGYGLSECASVVAVNTLLAQRAGSVGRVLPHADVRIVEGEIHVQGATLLGYAGGVRFAGGYYATGDSGHLDEDGFLYVTGRRRNVFITSYGRNVSPEWVESELTASDAISQAWVYGEALPWNFAVVTPRAGAAPAAIEEAVAAANRRLPDYARVARWVLSAEPFSTANGQLTPNGRLRRSALIAAYRERMNEFYGADHDVVPR
jgi:long-subunit acyl-CoA synthetase (AMP-forming)